MSSAGNNGFASACASLTGITCSIFVDDMRLYLGSVIINRLPFRWQSGEICLRYAKTYRLINNNTRNVKVTCTRIL